MYIRLRPITSEVEDQTKRPVMFARESSPTKPAAATASTELKKSWIIGEACSRMPMPAVTLQNNTTQSSQKDRVRMALAAVTLAVVRIPWCSVGAVQPSGAHPG